MTPSDRLIQLETWRASFVEEVHRDQAARDIKEIDVEKRLRRIEKTVWAASGAGILIQLLLRLH